MKMPELAFDWSAVIIILMLHFSVSVRPEKHIENQESLITYFEDFCQQNYFF